MTFIQVPSGDDFGLIYPRVTAFLEEIEGIRVNVSDLENWSQSVLAPAIVQAILNISQEVPPPT